MNYIEYVPGEKKIWESGRLYERERILSILKDEQTKRRASSDWGVIGIVALMEKIEKEEEND